MSGIVSQNVGRPSGLVKAADAGGGAWTLINTLTSDGSDSDLSFTSGFDSTYPIYVFKCITIHAETDGAMFVFNLSDDAGSSYAVTKTSTAFKSYHKEDNSTTGLGYDGGYDLAQSTADQKITMTNDVNADDACSGELWIFKPSSTTFVKHWLSRFSAPYDESSDDFYTSGYANTTSAVNAITFKMSSGEIQGGKIKMYGIKDS